jgi:hypothetical protein
MRIILTILILLLSISPVSHADDFIIPPECEIVIDDFSQGIKPGWVRKSFKGETEYIWMEENGKPHVKATSNNAASGLIYQIEYDPRKYPYITWNWKVDNIISTGDASRKSGDDYGGRIYVVFPSFFFWKTKAINYIWANKLQKNKAVPNPYTSNDIMISVESGSSNTGKWMTETRNIYKDYVRVFDKEPPKVGAIAIMTDTDNTGESTSAGYGPIAICSSDPGK